MKTKMAAVFVGLVGLCAPLAASAHEVVDVRVGEPRYEQREERRERALEMRRRMARERWEHRRFERWDW